MSLSAQELLDRGVPYLDNYLPEQYGNAGKIWEIKSNDQGIVFLASNRGLLEFDGERWNQYRGSKGFTRSLHIVSDSLIYTGSDLDFGKWELNDLFEYEYTSLYPFKENIDQITEEFWGVHQMSDLIIFVSFSNVYVYKDDRLTKIAAPNRFSGSYLINKTLYLTDDKSGIYKFDGISLELEIAYPQDNPLHVTGIGELDNGLLFATQNKGLYFYKDGVLNVWSDALSSLLARDQIFSFTTINEEYFVFGTILNGIYITDKKGKVIQHINKQKGLPNNTILDLCYSPNGMLWVSMDLGISGIHLTHDTYYVFDHRGEFGTGQTALIDKGNFYLGTNQGLYTIPWKYFKNDIDGTSFSQLPGSTGQLWTISKVGNDVICGHDRGLFVLSEGKLKSINESIGVLEVVKLNDGYFLAGTYNGIHLYQYNEGSWNFVRALELIKGACSQIIVDKDGLLWVHIPNYGVIRVNLNKYYEVEDRKVFELERFKGDILYLKQTDGDVQVISEQAKYVYDPTTDDVKESAYKNDLERVKHRLPGNYLSRQINDTFLFHPIYNGFALEYKDTFEKQLYNDALLLRNMEIFNQDTSFRTTMSDEIPYAYNNLRINCRIPHTENVNYRYFLDGHMEKWSDWTEQSDFELLNLKERDYTLQIEGKMENGEVRKLSIPVNIQAPWYRTIYAYAGYIALLLLFLYGIYTLQRYKLKQQKISLKERESESLRELEENYKKEALVKKQEQLEREKTELEKELRSTRIQLVMKAKKEEDKSRLIQTIAEKLRKMQASESGNNRMKWKELFRVIDRHQEKENSTFQIHMDELNQDFTQKLKGSFPELTVYDVRLCTYIKSGLSTREIAEIMNVLPSSINVSRSRLRKKLKLDVKTDLYSFLEALH